jgi:hypothetical protein
MKAELDGAAMLGLTAIRKGRDPLWYGYPPGVFISCEWAGGHIAGAHIGSRFGSLRVADTIPERELFWFAARAGVPLTGSSGEETSVPLRNAPHPDWNFSNR